MLIQTERHDLGLLTLDHRNVAAPLPPGVAAVQEIPTYTCSHCQQVVVMNPSRVRERATCRGCSHLICDNCAAIRASGQPCKTFKQVIDEILERETRARPDAQIILP